MAQKLKIMTYLGDMGPRGHHALLSDGSEVLIPPHHALSIGDEYDPEIHSHEALKEQEAQIRQQELEREKARNPHLFQPPAPEAGNAVDTERGAGSRQEG